MSQKFMDRALGEAIHTYIHKLAAWLRCGHVTEIHGQSFRRSTKISARDWKNVSTCLYCLLILWGILSFFVCIVISVAEVHIQRDLGEAKYFGEIQANCECGCMFLLVYVVMSWKCLSRSRKMCVCVRERERERERKCGIYLCVCVMFMCVCV